MINFNVGHMSFNLPWFMFDIDNFQLITSPVIPGDIADTKNIVFAETPIPGLNYQPMNYGGGGNRRISFKLPIIMRNNTVGNVLLLKQFENLRNQATGLFGIFGGQFQPTPKVLYYWGTGSIPLIYNVMKCDFTHKEGWINELGMPKLSYVDIELALDETNMLYTAEEIFRKFASLTGMIVNAYNVFQSIAKKERPY